MWISNKLFITCLFALFVSQTSGQQIKYTEYDLDNGLHVILHQYKSAPVVAVSVMYHVGSKDESPQKTGMAHFFEHLLFEGSENMKRGDFMQIVSANGGQNNANTSQDRTFYYEVFPSNQLELGLWLESERMLHPKIDATGIKTQNEVVKEEKRLRLDNKPYGKFMESIFNHLFQGHPYSWQPIGSMDHLDAAKMDDFLAFFKKFYIPSNAVLSIAGDLELEKTKLLVAKYFSEIPEGADLTKPTFEPKPIIKQVIDTIYDANVQIPAIFAAYKVPGMGSPDSKVLSILSSILSSGASARLNRKMLDEKKNASQVATYNYSLEDHGVFLTYAFPTASFPLTGLLADMDAEILRLQQELISEQELTKIQNKFGSSMLTVNNKMIGIAENLANGYTFHNKRTNTLNETLAGIKSVSREDIRNAAKKYLNPENRVVLFYLPKK